MNRNPLPRRGFLGALLAAAGMLLTQAMPLSAAKPPKNSISIVPTINTIELVNGQLVASGTATAVIDKTVTAVPFENVPVNLTLAADQTGAAGCPILDLELGPINLNLLGLIVETSPICLQITAEPGPGNLLGNLLCGVANLLNDGLSLNQILGGKKPPVDASKLTAGLTVLLNEALEQLLDAEMTGITPGTELQCAILHLELGPLTLNLLGLVVNLDDCEGGPVTVDITAQQGALLGDLLCPLLGGVLPTDLTLEGLIALLLAQL